MSKSFKSDPAINPEIDEQRTVFRSASGNNFTSDVQAGYSMCDAIA